MEGKENGCYEFAVQFQRETERYVRKQIKAPTLWDELVKKNSKKYILKKISRNHICVPFVVVKVRRSVHGASEFDIAVTSVKKWTERRTSKHVWQTTKWKTLLILKKLKPKNVSYYLL